MPGTVRSLLRLRAERRPDPTPAPTPCAAPPRPSPRPRPRCPGEILGWVYSPAAGSGPSPGSVSFHPGGFAIATLGTCDSSARTLASEAEAAVVSIADRQALENPFPTAVGDASPATPDLLENAAEVSGDPARFASPARARAVHQPLVHPTTGFAPQGEAAEPIE